MGFFDRALREAGKFGGAILEAGLQAAPQILGGIFGGGLGGTMAGGIPTSPGAPRAPFRLPTFDVMAGGTPPFFPGAVPSSLPDPLAFGSGGGEMANFALPGGAPLGFVAPALGRALGGLLPGLAGGAAVGAFFGNGGGDCPTLFQPGQMTRRAVSLFHVTHPDTGREVWYRNVGKPILFSGDMRVCKRVEKVARLAKRSSRKR